MPNLKQTVLLVTLSVISFSCQSIEQDIASIENDLLPTFYIEGEKPAPASIIDRMEHHGVPGISIAVYKDGELAWAKGYGMADVEAGKSVTNQTLFQAASISKPVAAMGAHDMAEDGLIDLDTNINEYLTSWTLAENEFTEVEKVTVNRILNHTAGTTVWGFPGYSREEYKPTAVEVVGGRGNTDSIYVYKTPGESWQYSGGGYTVMQIAMSDVAGKPFEDIMKERVIGPLGMTSSTYKQPLPNAFHDRAATGYRRDSSAVEEKWHVYPEQAAAGLWTTPTDLGKYAVSVQQSLQGNQDAILNQTTAAEMLVAGDNDHGFGPGIRYNGSHFGHGGGNAGFRCDFVASMEGGNVVVIMTNSDNGSPLVAEVMQSIFRHYNWSGPEPDVRTKITLSTDQLATYTGNYTIPDVGELTLSLKDSSLIVEPGDLIQTEILLVAENDSTFFDAEDGTSFDFVFEDGQATGFRVQGLDASRVED